MSPTYADGDHVLIRRVPASRVKPGQVIVIAKPHPGDHAAACPPRAGAELMIKRVVAVPGDTRPDVCPPQAAETIVPPGQFVVFGDNPTVSHDSRQLGYFSADHLLGIVLSRHTRPRSRDAGNTAAVSQGPPARCHRR
jgi:signal peptidase I